MQLANLLQRTARRQPDKTATICGDRRQSWSRLMQRVSRCAGALKGLNVTPGDRLAILALNSDRYLEIQIAALWAELVLVPLNTTWKTSELIAVLEDTSASLLFLDDAFIDRAGVLANEVSSLQKIIYMDDGSTDLPRYEEMIEGASEIPAPSGTPAGDELAGIYYTGGTTGFPRGVMLSHSSLFHSGLYASLEMGYSSDEIYLHAAPMFHLADGSQAVANTLFGITQSFIPVFDAAAALETIEATQVTSLLLLPSMIQQMLDHPGFNGYDTSSIRRLVYGDAPSFPGLRERLESAIPGIELYQAYGLTEMGPLVSILRPEDHFQITGKPCRQQSVGKPMVGVDVKIVDTRFRELPAGDIGQIVASGKNAMSGYWNQPAETARRMIDGWILTGDLGFMDEDGYLYLHDRMDDAIEIDGVQVSSIKIEHALCEHPAVQEVAVIGLPGDSAKLSLHAIVRCRPGLEVSESDLQGHCEQRLGEDHTPSSISFRSDALPLTAPGKTLKRELRRSYRR